MVALSTSVCAWSFPITSSISRAVHPQLLTVDVNQWHVPVWASHSIFHFLWQAHWICEDGAWSDCHLMRQSSIARVWRLFSVCDRMPPSATGSTWWERSTQRSSTVGESCLPHLHRTVTDWLRCLPSPWLILLRPCWWHGNEILLGQRECFVVCTFGGMCMLTVSVMLYVYDKFYELWMRIFAVKFGKTFSWFILPWY